MLNHSSADIAAVVSRILNENVYSPEGREGGEEEEEEGKKEGEKRRRKRRRRSLTHCHIAHIPLTLNMNEQIAIQLSCIVAYFANDQQQRFRAYSLLQ